MLDLHFFSGLTMLLLLLLLLLVVVVVVIIILVVAISAVATARITTRFFCCAVSCLRFQSCKFSELLRLVLSHSFCLPLCASWSIWHSVHGEALLWISPHLQKQRGIQMIHLIYLQCWTVSRKGHLPSRL